MEQHSGEGEDGTSAQSAPCPVCGQEFPIERMNSHIDLCLVAAETGGQSHETEGKSTPLQPQERAEAGGCKRPSPATPCPRPGGKQSLLEFEKLTPPPAKTRKISASSTPKSSRTRHEGKGPASVSGVGPSVGSADSELTVPLAEAMRPSTVDDFVGQEAAVGRSSILRTVLDSGEVPSLIFWGPPGCGKTTLARIIAKVAREKHGTRFVQLSATTSGVSEVKEVVRRARNERVMFRRKTILFVDEIHRFNKLQQDTFLPHVEDGTITLLGATTENPSFQLNSALLSRCRVIVLEKLQSEEIEVLLRRALPHLGAREAGGEGGDVMKPLEVSLEIKEEGPVLSTAARRPLVLIESSAITALAQLCDGDARSALNGLQVAVQAKRVRFKPAPASRLSTSTGQVPSSRQISTPISSAAVATSSTGSDQRLSSELCLPSSTADTASSAPTIPPVSEENTLSALKPTLDHLPLVTVADAKESLQRTHLLYDKSGEEHYNCISALHKSMRGSDASASLYWMARMLCAGEDPLYVARRVVCFASEDVGLADPNALCQAVAAFQACQFNGMPECEVNLAQAVVYMARAPKSVEVYSAYGKAKACVKEHKGPLPSVPLHLRNAPTKLMVDLGYGKGYKYNPAFSEPVEQQYMPNGLEGMDFFGD